MKPNPFKYAKAMLHKLRSHLAKKRLLEKNKSRSVDPDDFVASLGNPTGYYEQAFVCFHEDLQPELREHRDYFSQERRGFGEDAFHTMWWKLSEHFQPENFLEIGVYRGQVISLVSLISKITGRHCEVTGISPFSSIGDSVSIYKTDVDYQEDTLKNFAHFGLDTPTLLKAYSTDEEAVRLIQSKEWDLIYIDGNHDYDIVIRDWKVCSDAVKIGGIIVIDDSGLSTSYKPPAFATGGHPGPSKLASEIDRSKFEEVLQVGHNRVFKRLS